MNEQKLAKASFSYMGNVKTSPWSPSDVDKLDKIDQKAFHKIVKQCRFFYRKDPTVSTVINKLVEFSATPLEFNKAGLTANELRIFESISDELQEFAEMCFLEYLVSGLVVPEVNFARVTKEQLMDKGIKKYPTLLLPVSMWLRDPSTIKINTSMLGDKPSYYVVLPEEMIYFILHEGMYPDGTKDKELYAEILILYPEFVAQVRGGVREVLLDNPNIIRRKVVADSPYPTPYLSAAIEALEHKRNLRRMDYSLASRVITAIQIFKLGDKDFPVTEGDEDRFSYLRDQMAYRGTSGQDIERIFQLFSDHTLQVEWSVPPVDALLSDTKYREINQDIMNAVGFSQVLISGENSRSNSGDNELASISPVKSMENMRRKIRQVLQNIVVEIAKQNSLKSYPVVTFSPINLHKFYEFVQAMTTLYNSGNISRTTFDKALGYNWWDEMSVKSLEEDELERLGLAPEEMEVNDKGVPQEEPGQVEEITQDSPDEVRENTN